MKDKELFILDIQKPNAIVTTNCEDVKVSQYASESSSLDFMNEGFKADQRIY